MSRQLGLLRAYNKSEVTGHFARLWAAAGEPLREEIFSLSGVGNRNLLDWGWKSVRDSFKASNKVIFCNSLEQIFQS